MSVLKSLNPTQQEAVKHFDGPLLIIAGAGSGKTRVLTHRIAYLIKEKHIPARDILAVTFTNKAANEMKHRLKRLIGILSRNMWVGTFHAICGRILRRDIDKIGMEKNFVIFDTDDQLSLMRSVIKELKLDEEKKYRPLVILQAVGRAKNELIGPKDLEERSMEQFEENVAKAYVLYQKKLVENNALDFDDMLCHTVKLFKESPKTLESYQERLKYISIDEYQDTNHVQYTLTKLLAGKYKNICVVGDNDQSIYGWRGANFKNILNFERDYKNVKVVVLEQNYRSTQNILNAANRVIMNNTVRKEKNLWTKNPEGDLPTHFTAINGRSEAMFIAEEIKKLTCLPAGRSDKFKYSDFAVLYRTNAQSRLLEEVFLQEGLPYRIISGVRFYERREIKDIIAYLRIIVNSKDNISAIRIMNNALDGIGKGTLAKLEARGSKEGRSIIELLQNIDTLDLSEKIKKALGKFIDMINGFKFDMSGLSASQMIEKVIYESGYKRKLEEEHEAGKEETLSRVENIKELMSVAKEYEKNSDDNSLPAFLAHVSLMTDLDNLDEKAPAITLMTLHSAKGLEFPAIFMAGMEEGIFPHYRSIYDPAELEEERRLCYVGMTRAKQKLYLVSAQERLLFGDTWQNGPSRFIEEIPESLLNSISPDESPVEAGTVTVNEDFENVYQVGQTVNHPKWGPGEIMGISGTGSEVIIKISFENGREKELMAKYAPLSK
ncbi:ATP-dependent helicase [Candidatus Margulisiibacteriota bacterium]